MMITEAGWNDSPLDARREACGAPNTLCKDMSGQKKLGLRDGNVHLGVSFPAPLYTYGDYYAFVTPDFTPMVVYEAVKRWSGN